MLSEIALALTALSAVDLVESAIIKSVRAVNTSNPIAQLSYGTFEGRYSATYNLTYFRKIPFAAPPLGENRYRAPQPPLPITNGTYDSDQTYDFCVQRTVNGTEDCLYLGLYARPWQQGSPLRPVMINFFGGAFIEGGGSFAVLPAAYPILNASTENDYITVYPNYRVNSFGFLAGKAIADDPLSDLNVGLLDQHAALKWINENIAAFGGDKDDVTLWGQSAGAGSVVAQAIANPKYQQGLTRRALTSSPFWPHNYRYDSPEAEAIYQSFAELAGCSGPDSLACLKAADLQTLRDASLAVSASHTYNTSSYTWAPVIDDDFLNLPLSGAWPNIRANLPDGAWGMYNTHEGENFIPPSLASATTNVSAPAGTAFNSSIASFSQWVSGFLPNLTASQTDDLVTNFYPPTGSSESIPSYNSTYTRAGLIYRDIILACPAYWLASGGVPSNAPPSYGSGAAPTGYLGEYTIPPAKHGSDTQYWNQVNAIQKTDPVTYQGFAGAFASWFATGDPNAHKLTGDDQAGVPDLSSGEEWTIATDIFRAVNISSLERRCAFWASVADNVPV